VRGLFVSIACAAIMTLPAAARADDKSDCHGNKDVEVRLKTCSALIQHDSKDATAYLDRGNAYQYKGEVDHAIADYDKAIELKPDYAAVYDVRARAYVSKGDYTRALDDVTKGGELNSKAKKAAAPKTDKAKPAAKAASAAKPASEKKEPEDPWSTWAKGK
jgi:tetratricopeptide (TPR) repeat protein